MEESPLVDKILANRSHLVNHHPKVSDFISCFKTWNIGNLKDNFTYLRHQQD